MRESAFAILRQNFPIPIERPSNVERLSLGFSSLNLKSLPGTFRSLFFCSGFNLALSDFDLFNLPFRSCSCWFQMNWRVDEGKKTKNGLMLGAIDFCWFIADKCSKLFLLFKIFSQIYVESLSREPTSRSVGSSMFHCFGYLEIHSIFAVEY